jgi:hypothetical protein
MYRSWLFANIRFGICDSGRAQLNPARGRKHDGGTVDGVGRAGSPCNLTARGDVCG